MAASFFTVLDDIAILADDIAIAAKTSIKNTVGILGDDVAVGAKQATGFSQSRELSVIWSIAKGSLLNKIIILPIVFLISYIYPPLLIVSLIFGGLYLAFEGFEGFLNFFHSHSSNSSQYTEQEKIKGAIQTDFILSIEIIILALSSVKDESLFIQFISSLSVSFLATFCVYSLVALIVRLDDLGFFFKRNNFTSLGNFFINSLPFIIKFLSVVGVFAMLLVSGGIFFHNLDFLHFHFINDLSEILSSVIYIISSFIVGGIIFLLLSILKKLKGFEYV